jgi:hypothetical protein
MRVRPSGEKLQAETLPSCLSKVRRHLPLRTSQSFSAPSQAPETRVRPSGEKPQASTAPLCPKMVVTSLLRPSGTGCPAELSALCVPH